MRRLIGFIAAGAAIIPGAGAAQAADGGRQHIGAAQLCVTNGEITSLPGGHLSIETPSSRAFVLRAGGQAAEIHFRYLGPSKDSKPLASGEMRRQIGLKLHAQDSCNLIYAMWHIEPDSKIWVLVKRNPGQSTHAQCGAHGYIPIHPRKHEDLAPIKPGDEHSLRAELQGEELTVRADGHVVWEGTLGGHAANIDGPLGLRTDNAAFTLDYYVLVGESGKSTPAPDQAPARCEKGPGD